MKFKSNESDQKKGNNSHGFTGEFNKCPACNL